MKRAKKSQRNDETLQDPKHRNQPATFSVANGRGDAEFQPKGLLPHDIIIDVMGQITIEIPQRMKRTYRIVSEDSARDVLDKLDSLVKEANHLEKNQILGLWADRKESAEEISRGLRRKSNTRSSKSG